jgi:cell division protein FtsB
MQHAILKKMSLICFVSCLILVYHFKNLFHHISKKMIFSFSLQLRLFVFSHHFGYQCKVQTYGFSRLIDLLEELSHVVKVRNIKDLF